MGSKCLFYNEIDCSKDGKYHLEKTDSNIVALTPENVHKVLAMISYDSSYNKVFDVKSEAKLKKNKSTPITNEAIISKSEVDDNINYRDGHFGSSAYWFTKLNASKNSNEFRYYLFKTICAVDNENSTHLNGDGVGRLEIWERLCNITNNSVSELKHLLMNEDFSNEDGMKLISVISEETQPETGKRHRRNISFASKYCHYACVGLLDESYADKFPIYDTIVKAALPFYAGIIKSDYYNESVTTAYKEFTRAITILSKNKGISKNGIDQLLWYYYKGHDLPK